MPVCCSTQDGFSPPRTNFHSLWSGITPIENRFPLILIFRNLFKILQDMALAYYLMLPFTVSSAFIIPLRMLCSPACFFFLSTQWRPTNHIRAIYGDFLSLSFCPYCSSCWTLIITSQLYSTYTYLCFVRLRLLTSKAQGGFSAPDYPIVIWC